MVDIELAKVYFDLGRQLFIRNDFAEAEEAFKKAVLANPNDPMTYTILGGILMQQGNRTSEAEGYFRKAIAVDSTFADAYHNLGLLFTLENRLGEAESAYRKTIAVDPHHQDAYHSLGTLLNEQGRLIEAEDAFRKAITADPNRAETYFSLAVLLTNNKRWKEAEEIYRKAVEVDPTCAPAYYNLGLLYSEQNRLKEAEDSWRKAISADSSFANAYTNLGNLLLSQNRLNEAKDLLRGGVTVEPNSASSFYLLGEILFEQNSFNEAEAAWRKAVLLDPNLAPAFYNLGNLLYDQNRLKEAEDAYRKATVADPRLAIAYYNLGNLLYDQNRLKEAETAYRMTIVMDPNHADAYNNLGGLLVDQNRVQEANGLLDRARQLDSSLQAAKVPATATTPPSQKGVSTNANNDQEANNYDINEYFFVEDKLGSGPYDVIEKKYRQQLANVPHSIEAKFDLAYFFAQAFSLEKAEPLLREIIQNDKKNKRAYALLLYVLITQGKNKGAQMIFRLVKENGLDDESFYINYAKLLIKNGLAIEAIPICQMAIGESPSIVNAYYYLADAYDELGRYQEAVEVYFKAIEHDVEPVLSHFKLGVIFMRHKQYEDAERAYKCALEINPGYQNARTNLALLQVYKNQ